jgi:hypothetical protein
VLAENKILADSSNSTVEFFCAVGILGTSLKFLLTWVTRPPRFSTPATNEIQEIRYDNEFSCRQARKSNFKSDVTKIVMA